MLTPEPQRTARPKEVLPYPQKGVIRWLLQSPVLLHRLGLGELLNTAHIIILTTRGRKSGLPRHTPVEYRMHGTKVYLVSGWGQRPHWVQNLLADPCATVQAGTRTYGARAHLVTDTSEILRVLFLFRKRAPAVYDALIARLTDADDVDARKLPDLAEQLTVIRLDVNHTSDLPGIPRDLAWVWGAAGFTFVALLMLRFALWRRGAKQTAQDTITP